MNRRYALLIAFVALGIVAVSLLARMPRDASRDTTAAAAVPSLDLALEIENGRLSPESAAVPKGHLVRLTITNRGGSPLAVRLAGYEDRVTIASLAPSATWSGEFVADRPGDDFAWIVNEHPAGRLAVTGSHLIEGHR
jgi:hypothetical protein